MGALTDFKIEVHTISFSSSDSYLLTFSNTYTVYPTITASVVLSATPLDENVNVFIENITTIDATIKMSSSDFAGNVNVQIIGT